MTFYRVKTRHRGTRGKPNGRKGTISGEILSGFDQTKDRGKSVHVLGSCGRRVVVGEVCPTRGKQKTATKRMGYLIGINKRGREKKRNQAGHAFVW